MPFDSALNDAPELQLRHACADLNQRVRAGAPTSSEEFLAAYPALAANAELALELIYSEFVTRQAQGQQPLPEDWYRRFPQWRARLQRLFHVHELMTEDALPGQAVGDNQRRIGHYELLEELGRGGMGVVYKAKDLELDRVVALKTLRTDVADAGPQLARFRTEVEAVAQLQHPNVVPIFEVGESEGRPYFAMELVAGGNLAQQIAGRPQLARQAAMLIKTLALAIQHAHQRGIVHRDLKPANVLLAADGTPKITDFGLAKRLDGRQSCGDGQTLLGTLSYMAPEQAAPSSQVEDRIKFEVGPAADIYALGAILYELLTGRPPFGIDASLQSLTQLLSEEPVPPGRLQPTIPGDLETICLKCLRKEPHRRYSDAAALAADLERFLAGEPIRARPVAVWERAWKWARRKPAAAALLLLGVTGMLVLLAGSLWFNARLQTAVRQAEQAEHAANEQAELLRKQLDYSQRNIYALQLASVEVVCERDPIRGLELLEDPERCPAALRDFTWGYFYRQCKRDRLVLREPTIPVLCMAISPDSMVLAASMGNDKKPGQVGEVKLWDATTGRVLATLPTCTHPDEGSRAGLAHSIAFFPDGRKLAFAGGDRWQKVAGEISVWDVAAYRKLAVMKGHQRCATSLAISPDGRTLATGSIDRTISLWDANTQEELANFEAHAGPVTGIAFSPDGKTLASISSDKTAKLWSGLIPSPTGAKATATARSAITLAAHTGPVACLAFSSDGKTLATGGADQVVNLWDVAAGKPKAILKGHANRVTSVHFAPTGMTLISGGEDQTIRVWDVVSGREMTALRAHEGGVSSVAFAPNGNTFVSAGADRTLKIWDVVPGQPWLGLQGHKAKALSVAFAADGTALATASADHSIVLWDMVTQKSLRTLNGHTEAVRGVAFSADGHWLASASEDKSVRLWDLSSRTECLILSGHERYVDCVAFSPDGTLVSGSLDKTIRVWDAKTGRLRTKLTGHADGVKSLVFSRNGSLCVSTSRDHTVKLWDTGTWQELATLEGHTQQVNAAAFSPDGKTLASGSSDRTVILWDLDSRKARITLRGHTHSVASVAFSPDGKTFASGTGDRFINAPGEVKLWDALSGQVRATLQEQSGPIAFSPDGRLLVTATPDGSVKLWAGWLDH